MLENEFEKLSLNPRLLRALSEEGYKEPTPIQTETIPLLLAGRDLLGTARTGTGKTAAFALPILQRLLREPSPRHSGTRALILTPTRELALQVGASFEAYGRHVPARTAVLVGGVPLGPQIRLLRQKPEIVVATPGRLLDLVRQGHLQLGRAEVLVLDEADRMLDMGFLPDIRRIVDLVPRERQTMLFSATMPNEVASLASDMLRDPVRAAVTPPASVPTGIDQEVLFVGSADKSALLVDILGRKEATRVLVFTRTKHRADRVARQVASRGVSVQVIHSNKSQNVRQRALEAFARGRVRVLVATDIVARGIDVEDISHVINFELPNDPQNYVHRIGRTARAGARGVAVSFCDVAEVPLLHGMEQLTAVPLARKEDHPFHSSAAATLDHGNLNRNPTAKSGNKRSGWRSFRPKRMSIRRAG